MYVFLYVHCLHEMTCSPVEGIRSPETEIIGSDFPDVDAGNLTLILSRPGRCLNH